MFTSLTLDGPTEHCNIKVDAVSSLADTWIDLKNEESNKERVRSLLIVKSRGMGHSNKRHDFTITNKGIEFTIQNKQQKIHG